MPTRRTELELGFFAAGLMSVARLAAIAGAAVAQAGSQQTGSLWLLAGLFTYGFVRAAMRREFPAVVWVDVALVVAALALADGLAGPYLMLGLVTSVGAGLVLGPVTGTTAAVMLGTVAVVAALVGPAEPGVGTRELLAVFALHPALAAMTGLAARLRSRDRLAPQLLADTQRALINLHALTEQFPQGLATRNVVATALGRMKRELGATAGGIALYEDGQRIVLGEFVPEEGAGGDRVTSRDDGDATSARAHREAFRTLRVSGEVHVVLPEGQRWHRRQRRIVRDLATTTGLALSNAELFDGLAQLSGNQERRRVARELHDGVAQSIAHLRLELSLLERRAARHGSEDAADLGALVALADQTLHDIRATIAGFRAISEPGGLASRLQEHLASLRTITRTDLHLDVRGDSAFDADIESHVFRIAQEALSNALRHAGACSVRCSLVLAGDRMTLRVVDDGRGLPDPITRGVGMAAMEERAAAIGGKLEIRSRPSGGTRVELGWVNSEGAS